jgi:hypothetical protein
LIIKKKYKINIMSKFEKYYSEKKVPILEIEEQDRNDSIELMRSIFEIQSVSGEMSEMSSFIFDFVNNLKDESVSINSDTYGNIYVTKGDAITYPCIVSHIDTVHDIIQDKDYKVINSETEFFAINTYRRTSTGIGGDDNNGIYCCLDNLLREDVIKLAFFVDEEIGCVGSSQCNMDFFDDVSFVLQADRKGYEDVAVIIMGCDMMDDNLFSVIEGSLKEHGREVCDGGLTDVYQLAQRGLEVSMANFSCGYYQPHSSQEYVIIDELILTSILFRDIIKDAYVNGSKYSLKRDLSNSYSNDAYYDVYESFGVSKGINNQFIGNEDIPNDLDIHSHGKSCSKCNEVMEFDNQALDFFCYGCMDYDYVPADELPY